MPEAMSREEIRREMRITPPDWKERLEAYRRGEFEDDIAMQFRVYYASIHAELDAFVARRDAEIAALREEMRAGDAALTDELGGRIDRLASVVRSSAADIARLKARRRR